MDLQSTYFLIERFKRQDRVKIETYERKILDLKKELKECISATVKRLVKDEIAYTEHELQSFRLSYYTRLEVFITENRNIQ